MTGEIPPAIVCFVGKIWWAKTSDKMVTAEKWLLPFHSEK